MNTEFDDDLSELWRGSDDPGTEQVEALSERVLRRARWFERAELLVAAFLTIFLVFGIWRKFTLGSLVAGTLIILLLLWSARTRYRLRRIEWGAEERDLETYLEKQIQRSRARERRTWFDIALFGPATLLGMTFSVASKREGRPLGYHLIETLFTWSSVLGLVVLAATIVYLFYRLRQQRAAVRQLTLVLADHQRETEIDRMTLQGR
jgi:hypothetical protein